MPLASAPGSVGAPSHCITTELNSPAMDVALGDQVGTVLSHK